MKDITPEHLRCPLGDCPAVYKDRGNLIVVGKKPSQDLLDLLDSRVGADEQVVVISPEYFPDLYNREKLPNEDDTV